MTIRAFYPILIFVSFLNGLHFDIDDWFIVQKMGEIKSITEDYYNVHFLTENGIFSCDKTSGNIDLNLELYSKEYNPQILHYDENTDFYWLISRNKIFVKSSVSSYWNELYNYNLEIPSGYITNIGSSSSYVWLEIGFSIYPIYGNGVKISDNEEINSSEVDFIEWSSYHHGQGSENIDISQYVIFENWNVGLRSITHKDGYEIHPNVKYKDNQGNIWFGTKEGVILKGSDYSSRLEVIQYGPHSTSITSADVDKNGNWYFGDSYFKRHGRTSRTTDSYQSILTHWNENENSFSYLKIESLDQSLYSDVHDIFILDTDVFVSTLNGLLQYDTIHKDWSFLNSRDGLKDNAIWDISYNDNSLYLCTKLGIDEVSTQNFKVIPNIENWVNAFNGLEIYQIKFHNNHAYISCENGIYEVNLVDNKIAKISEKQFLQLQIIDNSIWGVDNVLWEIIDGKEIKRSNRITNFYLFEDYLWTTNGVEVRLQNLFDNREWSIPINNENKSIKIYNIESNEDWAWFLTNKGVHYYYWSELVD
jgi:hypothetical protein